MFSLVLILSRGVAWFALRRKRALREGRREESVAFNLAAHTFEFSVLLAAVLAFYHVLLLASAVNTDWLQARFLLHLEQQLVWVQAMLDKYKVDWTKTLVVLLAFYGLGLLRIRLFQTETPFRAFKKTNAVLRVTGVLAFLLASFTLLGSAPGEAARSFEVQLRHERSQYGILRGEVRTLLIQTATAQAFDSGKKSVSGGSDTAGRLIAAIQTRDSTLRVSYSRVAKVYELRDSQVETRLRRADQQRLALKRVTGTVVTSTKSNAAPDEDLPGDVSTRSIGLALVRLREFVAREHPDVLKLFGRPGAKEIVFHLAGLPIKTLTELGTSPISDAYPVFRPAFATAAETASDLVKPSVERMVDRLTRSVASHADDPADLLRDAGKEAFGSAYYKPSTTSVRQYESEVSKLGRELRDADATASHLETTVRLAEERHIALLFKRLHRSEERTRETAARELSERGTHLSQHDVEHLIAEMRNRAAEEWRTDAVRGHHCWDYTYRNSRYYAAQSIEKMTSPYVTPSIRGEASQTRQVGKGEKRVHENDPGWI